MSKIFSKTEKIPRDKISSVFQKLRKFCRVLSYIIYDSLKTLKLLSIELHHLMSAQIQNFVSKISYLLSKFSIRF